MKYLNTYKSFKIFESSSKEDLLGTINDILLPISDSGIEYKIDDLKRIGLIHITINGQNVEINDCIDHLTNYLKDLGIEHFVGRKIEDETHISIENDFNDGSMIVTGREIEEEFLEIIDGIREVKNPKNEKSRLWITPNNYSLFNQDEESGYLYYDYIKILLRFQSKFYSLGPLGVNEIVRYMVGKHLKLDALKPLSANSFSYKTMVGNYLNPNSFNNI